MKSAGNARRTSKSLRFCCRSDSHIQLRSGLTVVELLVALGVMALLAGVLLPAVQSARESARQSACSNRLRQITLAAQLHESALGVYPATEIGTLPRYQSPLGDRGLFVKILTYLDSEVRTEDPSHRSTVTVHPRRCPSHFLCPSSPPQTSLTGISAGLDQAVDSNLWVETCSYTGNGDVDCGNRLGSLYGFFPAIPPHREAGMFAMDYQTR